MSDRARGGRDGTSDWVRAAAVAFLISGSAAAMASSVELRQKTILAFDCYVKLTEEEREASIRKTHGFLWIDRQAEARRGKFYERLRHGGIVL